MDPMLPENVTAAAPAAAPASEYEFNDAQNRVFSDLGGAMGSVAVALVVLGVFSTLVGGLALLDGARADGLAGLGPGCRPAADRHLDPWRLGVGATRSSRAAAATSPT